MTRAISTSAALAVVPMVSKSHCQNSRYRPWAVFSPPPTGPLWLRLNGVPHRPHASASHRAGAGGGRPPSVGGRWRPLAAPFSRRGVLWGFSVSGRPRPGLRLGGGPPLQPALDETRAAPWRRLVALQTGVALGKIIAEQRFL